MGPKKAAGSKKLKTGASTSKATSPYDVDRFSGLAHYERYQALQKRKIWPEKQFNITPDGKFMSFISTIDDRNWARLINPPPSINVDLVREFYANAMPVDEDEP
ncbi:hypothetical protein A2U01_0044883, partial [Trifolium medium]|nr:hypothetical protein [Trifolium medium]